MPAKTTPTKEPPAPRDVKRYRAKYTFGVSLNGEQITVAEGEIVREGHPVLKGRMDHFEEATSFGRFDVETATKRPGERK